MKPPYKNRKKIHLSLFVFVILLQIILVYFWYSQSSEQKDHLNLYSDVRKANLAFRYSNEASKHYFNAENEFMDYFHSYNSSCMTRYENSLQKMSLYLDSLNTLVRDEKYFRNYIQNKKKKEKEIISLRMELEKLLNTTAFKKKAKSSNKELSINPYNYKKALNSITYDSIRVEDQAIRKGLIGRISDAISGKTPIKKEELHVTMTMKYGDQEKTGTVEDQLKNAFVSANKHYSNEFDFVKKTYNKLKKRDQELLEINKTIQNNSQEIILFYNEYIQEANKKQLKVASESIDLKKNIIFILLALMSLCTLLLMSYSMYAYLYEKDLSAAKSEAENSLKFRNRIIGMLSHEMRAPLNIIANITSKLKSVDLEQQKTKENINLLYFTSNSLQITVNQILNYFKSENSKLTIYNSKVQLYQEIKSILESMESLSQSKELDFSYILNPNLNKEVYIDTGKLHQLFYNIIGNAIKFTDKGGVKIECELISLSGYDKLVVKTTDTGIGIPEKDLEKVFDKFYQSDNSRSKISFGTGLGLNICKEIVTHYKGTISIKSKQKIGSEITFDLLLENTNDSLKSSQEQLIERFEGKNISVAVVDDDKLILSILQKLLTNINFNVVPFSKTESIKSYLENNSTDLIITDIQIGESSGIDLVQSIKNLNNDNKNTPIIMITGDEYMSTISLETLLIDEIIIKPINKEEFYTKLLKLLK